MAKLPVAISKINQLNPVIKKTTINRRTFFKLLKGLNLNLIQLTRKVSPIISIVLPVQQKHLHTKHLSLFFYY